MSMPIIRAASGSWAVARMALLTDTKIAGAYDFFSAISIQSVLLFIVLYALYVKYKKHPIFYIFGAAVVGIVLKM